MMSDTHALTCRHCFADRVEDGVCQTCQALQAEPDRDQRALRVWSVVGGKYRVGEVLGAGGFGITYLAQDVQLGRRVALKEYLPSGLVSRTDDRTGVVCNAADDRAPFKRGLLKFFEEGKILAKFDAHANIVHVFEVFEANGTAYLAMEYLEGMTLKAWIQRSGRLSTAKALKVTNFIIDALRAVHAAKVVHRDLKPDNVYVTNQGRTLLLDFGGAKQLLADQEKSVDITFAHGYTAPEQYASEDGKVGPWTDVYACGATLYKMLTGRTMQSAPVRAAGGSSIEWAPSEAPASLRRVIERAMALDRNARHQTVDEFADQLFAVMPMPEAELQPSTPTWAQVRPPSVPPAPDLFPRANRRLILVAAGAAGVGALAVWQLTRPDSPKPKPAPPPPEPPLTPLQIDQRLAEMVTQAAASRWALVEAPARAIDSSVMRSRGSRSDAPSSLRNAGEEAIETRDYRGAERLLRHAATEQPGDWRSWTALGYALLRQDRPDASRDALRNALRIEPKDPWAWATLGEIHAQAGSTDAAAALQLAVYFSSNRAKAIEHLRSSEFVGPKFRALIRAQAAKLGSLPPRPPP
jgi:serine/threonine protein kinase